MLTCWHPFFNASWDRFLCDLGCQLAFQNPSKSTKNRCQRASILGFNFWLVFDWFFINVSFFFLPTSTCATLPIVVFTWGKRRFVRNTLFHALSLLNSNLIPTWLHFAFQISTKIHEKSWKYRPQEAPNNATIFASFRDPKNLPLGTQLGAILALQTAQETPQTPPKRPTRQNSQTFF